MRFDWEPDTFLTLQRQLAALDVLSDGLLILGVADVLEVRVLALHFTLLDLFPKVFSILFSLPARMELLNFLAGRLLAFDLWRRHERLTGLIDGRLLFDALIQKKTIAQVELLIDVRRSLALTLLLFVATRSNCALCWQQFGDRHELTIVRR